MHAAGRLTAAIGEGRAFALLDQRVLDFGLDGIVLARFYKQLLWRRGDNDTTITQGSDIALSSSQGRGTGCSEMRAKETMTASKN